MVEGPAATWPTTSELQHLVERFRDCTLPKAEWTHAAHLVVGTWHVAHFGEGEALEHLRSNIRRLNESYGGENTDTNGYHETITKAYVTSIARFLALQASPDDVAACARSLLASPMAARDFLLRFYSRDVLMSVAARRAWIEPDLGPIRADASPRSAEGTP